MVAKNLPEPRPPTPPRASSSSNIDVSLSADGSIALVSPLVPPSSETSSPHPLTDSQSKRVNFSPMNSYIRLPDFTTEQSIKSRERLRSLPPSSSSGIPAKSILKSRALVTEHLHSDELRSSPPADMPGMLSSIIEQLSGSSHLQRRDAYTQLVGCLSAYSDQPDAKSIVENISLFVSWIKRDIDVPSSSITKSDYTLAHQALNLLNMLVFKTETSPSIPDDFKIYVLDRAISAIQDNSTPKTIIIDYMRLLTVQNFSPRILTSSRVTRLLDAIRGGPDRVGGKAVTALRLNVYDRLFCQARSVFASHASFWMDNLVAGLLHEVRDIRAKAIALGFRITDSLGPNAHVSKAIGDVLNLPMENEAKFINDFCDRLTSMINRERSPQAPQVSIENREKSQTVPQIWSVATLLLRSPRWSVDNWEHFKPWMMVIQTCFNCSDTATNSQALLAWNRLVYVVQPSVGNRSVMAKFLFRPIDSQLERKRVVKRGSHTDQAFSSYCNLLYYSCRPGTPFERLDLSWAEYIALPSTKLLKWNSDNALGFCDVLAMLLWNPHPKVWDEKRAIDTTKVGPHDLPRLDCNWVRSRVPKVLSVFEKLFDLFIEHDSRIDGSPLGQVWVHLSRSLADASNKEVQPSNETMQATGSILESLQRIWRSTGKRCASEAKDGNTIFHPWFLFLVKTIVTTLGSVAFTEKMLLKTSPETFSVGQTPTHRRTYPNGHVKSPILHLIQFICHSPYSISMSHHKGLFHGVLEIGLAGRTSRGSRLVLLRQFAESTMGSTEGIFKLNSESSKEMWKSISVLTQGALTTDTNVMGKDEAACRDYDKVVGILELSTKFGISSVEWSSLFQLLVTVVRKEQGDIKASVLVDSFVGTLLRHGLEMNIGDLPLFMQSISFPREPVSGQSLKFIPEVQQRYNTQKTCDSVVTLANERLLSLYATQSDTSITEALTFLDAISQWLKQCPLHYRIALLEKLQTGLAPWLADPNRKLVPRADVANSILTSARNLTSIIIDILSSLQETNNKVLAQLATLMAAGFESNHRSIVNKFVLTWNASFGLEDFLAYPAALESILRKLDPYVELKLPAFPKRLQFKDVSPPPEYLSSQESIATPAPIREIEIGGKHRNLKSVPLSGNRNRKRKSALETGITTPKRPRHDDSQVQFVTVEPSPSPTGPPESQLLTENQKSVRERQQKDTVVLFPNICASKSSPRQSALDALLDAPTPKISHEQTNDDVQSSPTPASRTPRSSFPAVDLTTLPSTDEWGFSPSEDPPSSPPQTVPSSQPLGFNSLVLDSNEDEGATPTPKPTPRTNPRGARRSKSAKTGEGESADLDIVLDSFVDPLEQQIASQLEQDLELSMDASASDNRTPKQKRKLGRSRKRKRDGDGIASSFDKALPPTPAVEVEVVALQSHAPETPPPVENAEPEVKSGGEDDSSTAHGRYRKRAKPSRAEEEAPSHDGSFDRTRPSPKKRRSRRLRGQAVDNANTESNGVAEVEQETPRPPKHATDEEDRFPTAAPEDTKTAVELDRPQTPSQDNSEAREQVSPGVSILQSLRSILESIRNVSFGRSTLRELDDVMFDIKVEAHNACQRNE